MLIPVTWWHDPEWDRWNAAVDGQPEVNATGYTEAHMREILVAAYTRINGTIVTEADFVFTERAA